MLFKIDYTQRSDKDSHTKFVDHSSDITDATKRFMEWFFRSHPDDAVKLNRITAIEIIGEIPTSELIEDAL